MIYKHFKIDIRNNIVIAFFENLKHGNSFSQDCSNELLKLFRLIKKKHYSGLIISTHHRIFCSGGNLSDYSKLKTPKDGIKINSNIKKSFQELANLEIPTICVVSGDCFGGGLEWIAHFDKIFCTPNVYFGMWQRRLSLTWGWGGGSALKMRIPKSKLKNLLLESETFDAFSAKKYGLVDEIYIDSIIYQKAMEACLKNSKLPQKPVALVKQSNLKNEKQIFEKLWMNKEHKKILENFKSKKASRNT